MNFEQYTKEAKKSMNNDLTKEEYLDMCALGLSGESGEIADHLKKSRYHGHKLDIDHLKEELGDLLWYTAIMADKLGLTLDEVANYNNKKLNEKRYPNGFNYNDSINRKD